MMDSTQLARIRALMLDHSIAPTLGSDVETMFPSPLARPEDAWRAQTDIALTLLLITIDPDLTTETRREGLQCLEEALVDDRAVEFWLADALMSVTMTPAADLQGALQMCTPDDAPHVNALICTLLHLSTHQGVPEAERRLIAAAMTFYRQPDHGQPGARPRLQGLLEAAQALMDARQTTR